MNTVQALDRCEYYSLNKEDLDTVLVHFPEYHLPLSTAALLLYHIISYHIISYYIISYYIMQVIACTPQTRLDP